MAASDLILVQKSFTNPVDSTVSLGLPEKLTLGTVLTGAPATTAQAGAVKQITFTAQQSPDFASLAAVTVAYNALLTKFIAAGIMPSS